MNQIFKDKLSHVSALVIGFEGSAHDKSQEVNAPISTESLNATLKKILHLEQHQDIGEPQMVEEGVFAWIM